MVAASAMIETTRTVQPRNQPTFADLLRAAMGDRTLAQMSAQTGWSVSSLSRWLTPGIAPPPVETIRDIAQKLGARPGSREEVAWLRAAYPDYPWQGSEEGAEPPIDAESLRILGLYEGLPTGPKTALKALLESMAREEVTNRPADWHPEDEDFN